MNGVLPDCYENTNVNIEEQELPKVSCFSRHKDDAITCPMGNICLSI